MELQVKSITIYVRESQFEQLLNVSCSEERDYHNIVWTLVPGDPSNRNYLQVPQVQLQVSLDTYNLLKNSQVVELNDPSIEA